MKSERTIHGCVKVANSPYLKTLDDYKFSILPTLNKEKIMEFKKKNKRTIWLD